MEDKTFPKDTSLRAGGRQELARVPEFKARSRPRWPRRDPDFCVIARCEAQSPGWGRPRRWRARRRMKKRAPTPS